MSENAVLFIIGQTLVGAFAALGLYVGLVKILTRMEVNQANMAAKVDTHRKDHEQLVGKVAGISRRVERHDTLLESISKDTKTVIQAVDH